ncbi:DNA-dependent metalloprotease SPRTN isoform X1 [Girardinichthys multiradiatus]|uniref:DNA-dependent metalloprotease SPRTN isoform X1 n=2 Tax=Girardinichthys multiradiatus TaxID=208333 RepID=UPI001FADD097|nr:DNA-dependent metalloprotease SPRTN isoform X1 [Girardinichthys multiradiatus]
MDADFLLASQLQEQFDNEYQRSQFPPECFLDDEPGQSRKKPKAEASGGGSDATPRWKPPTFLPERPLSIVDESWEMLDPNPDVRAMFLEFNDMFFWGKLSGVEVKWSPRMTLCAGVCSYEGRGGLCSIRLSEPLLKLRPRKDLVETLLHEMIHALLFVTQNNRDRDGHGPEFCKHMNRINKATGTNITVYHSFHDEVDVYRQHWWRCNGPCQSRKPYFGYVKRSMNRAPSSQDPWWEDHQRTCGGTYTKVKEPEGYGKKNKKETKASEKNIVGNGKLSKTGKGSGSQDIRNVIPFSGKGFLLGGTSQTFSSSSTSHSPSVSASSSFISSPKISSTPSSPYRSLSSPVCSGLSDQTNSISNTPPSFRPASTAGGKPPVKRSVGNIRVFVNINGSPVKAPKSQSDTGNQRGAKIKQTSIQDLFTSTNLRKYSISEPGAKRDMPSLPNISTEASPSITSNSNQQHSPLKSPEGSTATSTQSKYFSDSGAFVTLGSAGGGQTSRKRSWDARSSSAMIFDFFQKTLSSNSATSKEPVQTQSASGVAPSNLSSLQSSAGLHSGASSSSSSLVMMVSCPVCQTKIQERRINEHLDSCLS